MPAVFRKSNFQASCMEGLRIIFGDENILLLGTIQVLAQEGSFLDFSDF
jgi:hypothetical protein